MPVVSSAAARLGCLVGSHGWGVLAGSCPHDAWPGEAAPVGCFADRGELTFPALPACRARGRHVPAVLSATVLSEPWEMHLAQVGSLAPLPAPAAMALTPFVASLGGVEGGGLSLKQFGVTGCVAKWISPWGLL